MIRALFIAITVCLFLGGCINQTVYTAPMKAVEFFCQQVTEFKTSKFRVSLTFPTGETYGAGRWPNHYDVEYGGDAACKHAYAVKNRFGKHDLYIFRKISDKIYFGLGVVHKSETETSAMPVILNAFGDETFQLITEIDQNAAREFNRRRIMQKYSDVTANSQANNPFAAIGQGERSLLRERELKQNETKDGFNYNLETFEHMIMVANIYRDNRSALDRYTIIFRGIF